RLTVRASKSGFAPMRVSLRHEVGEDLIPDSYTLAMEAATSIGGNVRDEQGWPIVGASVGGRISGHAHGGRRESYDLDDASSTTDTQGRWRCDLIPAGIDLGHVDLRCSHPDFLIVWPSNTSARSDPARLRDRTDVMVLQRGLVVTGRVVDA